MEIKLSCDTGAGSIETGNEFRNFQIVIDHGRSIAEVVAAFPDSVRPAEQDHLWVRADAVVAWAGEVDRDWLTGFRAMLSKVEPHGWYDRATNEIKSHVVWS